MLNKIWMHWVFAALCVTLALFLAGCPGSGEGGEEESTGEWRSTDSAKYTKNGRRLIMEAWGEPEEDPRQLLGYELKDDGTPFFDRYVILYGGRIAYRNCAAGFNRGDDCKKTGLHIHIPNTYKEHIYDDAQNKLRPLQARGIKVLMSMVPMGDGACIGNLFSWRGTWNSEDEDPYPFDETASMRFVKDVADTLKLYGIDGVGYDEEYAAVSTGSGSDAERYPGFSNPYAGTSGKNWFRFGYELNKEMNGGTFLTTEYKNLEERGKIPQDMYEIRIPGDGFPDELRMPDGKTVKFTQVFDYGYSDDYGGWKPTSNCPFPASRYGPGSVAIADTDAAPRPQASETGIVTRMTDVLNGNYGIVMYYCFRSRVEVAGRWPNLYGPGHPEQEYYYSMISRVLFGQDTIYVGPDYARMF